MQQDSIACGCGCGALFIPFDKYGRARRYLVGHNGRGKPSPKKQGPVAPRFWPKVQKSDGCWEWVGYRRLNGSGEMYFRGRATKAHRVSWILHHGAIPKGLFVCHRCDNPPCVRPDHLFLGTNAENLADMTDKGRRSLIRAKGERHGLAKLNDDAVRDIRQRFEAGESYDSIGQTYAIGRSRVWAIGTRRSWKHVA